MMGVGRSLVGGVEGVLAVAGAPSLFLGCAVWACCGGGGYCWWWVRRWVPMVVRARERSCETRVSVMSKMAAIWVRESPST